MSTLDVVYEHHTRHHDCGSFSSMQAMTSSNVSSNVGSSCRYLPMLVADSVMMQCGTADNALGVSVMLARTPRLWWVVDEE